MKKTLTQSANAKINLYLRVTGRRDDGYHELYSIMQSVSLADTVTVSCDTSVSGRSMSLTCSDPSIPCDGSNIAAKCAERLLEAYGISEYSVQIHIEKRIPVSGGLAGGSADGAAVLRMLNELCGIGAKTEELCLIGAKVGADIPFCIIGGTAVCTGIGDILAPLVIPTPAYSVLIVAPGGGVSTPAAYRAIDGAGEIPESCTAQSVLRALEKGVPPPAMHNDFEAVILPRSKNVAEVKRAILEFGAVSAMMSGSGPTVFGLFKDAEKCEDAAIKMRQRGFVIHTCRPTANVL